MDFSKLDLSKLDIKKVINDVAAKIKADPSLLKKFKSEPIKAIESIVGVDLPDEKIQAIVAGVKTKLSEDDSKGVASIVKNIFKK